MRPKLLLFLLSFPCLLTAQSLLDQPEEAAKSTDTKEFVMEAKPLSIALINNLESLDFKSVNDMIGGELKTQLTASLLEQTWKSLESSYGPFSNYGLHLLKRTAEANYLLTEMHFEKENFDLQISLNENKDIDQLRIVPASNKSPWKIPSYVNKNRIQYLDTIIDGQEPLLAQWVFPRSDAKKSLVVFVHGSGPNDMDESLGPNKMFKDLAFGLASNGIASLRYNKRSYDYSNSMAKQINTIGIDDIVTQDAVAAIAQAKAMAYERVYLLGHSLGGHLAPKIAEAAVPYGVIVMAGNTSPLVDLLPIQYQYLMENDSSSGINEFQVQAIQAQVDLVKSGKYDTETNAMLLPLGMPAAFWLSLKGYNPLKLAKKQNTPYLILNGGRDYQVDVEQAKSWEKALKSKRSKTIIYPSLNHGFFSGTGLLLPSEYEKEAHLDQQVLIDICQWINSL